MVVVGYARVSSLEQADNTDALKQQINRLKDAGATQIVQDVESGRKDDRVNLAALMERVQRGVVSEIIITRLDRISRSLPHMRKILDILKENGVNLRALDDAIEWHSAGGKFHINMLGSLAEMESDRLSERISHGKAYFRKQGKVSHPPLGYFKKDEYTLELDKKPFICLIENKEEVSKYKIARHLIQTYIEARALTKTIRFINKYYGFRIFNTSSLRRWLLSPTIEGSIVYYPKSPNPTILPNRHKPIITIEEKAEVEAILKHNHNVRGFGSRQAVYPLSGLVKCSNCGRGCVIANGGSTYKLIDGVNTRILIKYYRCNRARDNACDNKNHVKADLIEEKVIEELIKRAETLANNAASDSESAKTVNSREIEELETQLKQLELIPGNNSAIIQAKKDIKLQINKLKTNTFRRSKVKEADLKILTEVFSNPEFFESLSTEEKRRVYHKLVDKIIVDSDKSIEVMLAL